MPVRYLRIFLAVGFTILSSTAILAAGPAAVYTVTQSSAGSTRLLVRASLPSRGTKLQMQENWPGNVPSVAERGWPALVQDLRVTDATGRDLEFDSTGPGGWALRSVYNGTLKLTYTIDYSAAAAAGWPAPRETAFADGDHFSFTGRSLFITTRASSVADVTFVIAPGWEAVGPWPKIARNRYRVPSTADLVDNMIVLTSSHTDEISAGGFRLLITPMGKWTAARPVIIRILRGVVPFYVWMMGAEPGEIYSVVLLPISDSGGESFRNSFAFNIVDDPTLANSPDWGHTIAHEIFHYWNGWRLRGTDYPSTQWFQEGFTDYAADMAMARSGSITVDDFLRRIEFDLERYGKLTTPLDAPGTHKGPPLYGGGALVALCWDIQIRNATGGRRTLADVLRTVWRRSARGSKTYEWTDIKRALEQAAQFDWEGFYQAYIHGPQKLPIADTLSLAGLKVIPSAKGPDHVEIDRTASAKQRSLRRSLIGIDVKGN